MTITALISQIRDKITVVDTDFTDAQILDAINKSKNALFARRPEAFMTTEAGLLSDEPADYASDGSVDMWPRFNAALIYYALHWLFSNRAKDAATQAEADRFLALFKQELG